MENEVESRRQRGDGNVNGGGNGEADSIIILSNVGFDIFTGFRSMGEGSKFPFSH